MDNFVCLLWVWLNQALKKFPGRGRNSVVEHLPCVPETLLPFLALEKKEISKAHFPLRATPSHGWCLCNPGDRLHLAAARKKTGGLGRAQQPMCPQGYPVWLSQLAWPRGSSAQPFPSCSPLVLKGTEHLQCASSQAGRNQESLTRSCPHPTILELCVGTRKSPMASVA